RTPGEGVDINLTEGEGKAEGLTDTIEEIENVIGSNFADTITGDEKNNSLDGRKGNDTLYGKAGNDTLKGGDGNDTLNGGKGNDYLYGEDGENTASFEGAGGGVSVKLQKEDESFGTAKDVTDGNEHIGNDKLFNIDNIIGTSNADIFAGNKEDNTIDGGIGEDTIDFSEVTDANIVVKLDENYSDGTSSGYDRLYNIENIKGTDIANLSDTLY
ncbi:hypothetical protein ADUPG1_002053, partial [Aduncisulcus paluster]